MSTLQIAEDVSIFHKAIRFTIPRRARFALYYARQARNSTGVDRRVNLAKMYSNLGWCRHAVDLPGDIRLTVDLRDEGIGIPLWSEGVYEASEAEYFRSVLRPSDVFVDIGANIGFFSILAGRCIENGRVIAIEPSPYNFSLLKRNIQTNRLCNITAVQMALGETPGTAVLNLSKRNYGDNRIGSELSHLGLFDESDKFEVPIDTLDRLLLRLHVDRVDCIKMDVQGFEAHVLAGMIQTLGGGVSTFMTEFWPKAISVAGKDPVEYLATFASLGFTPYLMTDEGIRPIAYDRIFDAVPSANRIDGEWINLVFKR